MSYRPVTLSEMLGLSRDPPNASLSVIEHSKCFGGLQKGKYPSFSAAFWRASASEILTTLNSTFSFPLGVVLSGAWNKYRELLKYTDAKRYPPETRTLATLATHTITSDHERHIDLFIDAEPAGTVDFKLTVKITLDAAKVSIQNARFMALHVGSFKFKGTLTCEGVTLIERTSKDYTPPGTISFGDGIPIVPV